MLNLRAGMENGKYVRKNKKKFITTNKKNKKKSSQPTRKTLTDLVDSIAEVGREEEVFVFTGSDLSSNLVSRCCHPEVFFLQVDTTHSSDIVDVIVINFGKVVGGSFWRLFRFFRLRFFRSFFALFRCLCWSRNKIRLWNRRGKRRRSRQGGRDRRWW